MPPVVRTRESIMRWGTSVRLVTARKTHVCADRSFHPDTCHKTITAGSPYVRSVIFAGHDAHPGPRGSAPRMHRLCPACALRYDTTRSLVETPQTTQPQETAAA